VLDSAQPEAEKVANLYLLSKEGVKRDALDARWVHAECYRPERLAPLLLSDDVLTTLRRLVKRDNPGRPVDVDDLREALLRGVIRGDLYNAITDPRAGRQGSARSKPVKKPVPELEPPVKT